MANNLEAPPRTDVAGQLSQSLGVSGEAERGPSPVPPGQAAIWDCHVHVFDENEHVAPGHYQVKTCSLQSLEAIAGRHGVGHLVLVQPSVYGSNNRLLLDALAESGGRHRGVIIASAGMSAASLDDMHKLGVRGVRVNLVSPVGNEWLAVEPILPHLRRLGWHVEWYAKPVHLEAIIQLHDKWRVPCVLAHLAGLTASDCADAALWRQLDSLAAQGGWIKVSAMYRLGAEPPYDELDPLLLRMTTLFGEKTLWGSDWPHTSLSDEQKPVYPDLWTPLKRVLPERMQAILTTNPVHLYSAGE